MNRENYGAGSARRTELDASVEVEVPTLDEDVVKAGIFNCKADSAIANRLVKRLIDIGCEANRFDFLPAGETKIGLLNEFITTHDACIWIASTTSIKDEGMMKAVGHISQYAAIESGNECVKKHFIPFKPQEYQNLILPLHLKAYTALIEDEDFDKRLESTLKRIKKKKRDYTKKLAKQNLSSSAANTSVGEQRHGQIWYPPVSDVAQTEAVQDRTNSSNPDIVVQNSEQVQLNLCAQPDSSDCTTSATSHVSTQEPVHNIFVITNSNVTIRTDGGNVNPAGAIVQEVQSGDTHRNVP